jgi:hypothetical protein
MARKIYSLSFFLEREKKNKDVIIHTDKEMVIFICFFSAQSKFKTKQKIIFELIQTFDFPFLTFDHKREQISLIICQQ